MIYDNVKRIAKDKGIPLYVIEDRAELGRGCISKWASGNPTIKNLQKVAEILGVDITQLLEES